MRPLCQILVCGVRVLGGYETLHDVFEENAHTEARDARCLHASELKQSIFLKSLLGRCAHRAGTKKPGSQTVTSFSSSKNIPVSRRSTPLMFLRDFCVSTVGRERRHQATQKKKNQQHCREGRGHVHPCCCLCFDKQATAPPPPSLHPCCRLPR